MILLNSYGRDCDDFESRDQTVFQRELTVLHVDTASIKEHHIIPTSTPTTPTLAPTRALTSMITSNLPIVFGLRCEVYFLMTVISAFLTTVLSRLLQSKVL